MTRTTIKLPPKPAADADAVPFKRKPARAGAVSPRTSKAAAEAAAAAAAAKPAPKARTPRPRPGEAEPSRAPRPYSDRPPAKPAGERAASPAASPWAEAKRAPRADAERPRAAPSERDAAPTEGRSRAADTRAARSTETRDERPPRPRPPRDDATGADEAPRSGARQRAKPAPGDPARPRPDATARAPKRPLSVWPGVTGPGIESGDMSGSGSGEVPARPPPAPSARAERTVERPAEHTRPPGPQAAKWADSKPRSPAAASRSAPRPRAVPPPALAAAESPAARTGPRPSAGSESPRLSKRMSELGICSRREADEWIENGWVRVDGVVVDVLGTRISPKATIEIDPAAKLHQSESVTILINKPIGYVSGQPEDDHQPAVVLLKPENRWSEDPVPTRFKAVHLRGLAPAGRLDIDSTGLLVMTQDGRVARALVGENSTIEKEYLVRVEGSLDEEGMKLLNHGLTLDDVRLKPAKVSWANEDQLRFVLREGRKRQIRRMCELVGLNVVGLKRVRIGSVVLGKLPLGQWRYLRADERF